MVDGTRNIDVILMEALENFEEALVDYTDHEYGEGEVAEIAQEITLRGNMYTSLGILREVVDEAVARLRLERNKADRLLERALKAEKKLAEIRNATK